MLHTALHYGHLGHHMLYINYLSIIYSLPRGFKIKIHPPHTHIQIYLVLPVLGGIQNFFFLDPVGIIVFKVDIGVQTRHLHNLVPGLEVPRALWASESDHFYAGSAPPPARTIWAVFSLYIRFYDVLGLTKHTTGTPKGSRKFLCENSILKIWIVSQDTHNLPKLYVQLRQILVFPSKLVLYR